jgi:YbbR domain-containing protein
VLDRLRANLGLKILALAIAFVSWGYLRFSANPVVGARFEQTLNIPISSIGLAPDLVVRPNDRTAAVRVVLPRGRNTAISADSIQAVLDLSERAPGVYQVPLRVVAPNVQIADVTPQSVTVSIERVEERSIPVAVHYLGNEPVVADDVQVAPLELRVRGASSDVARVASVRVDLPMPKHGGVVDTMVRPVPRDAQGGEIAGLSTSRSLVRVRAVFSGAKTAG